MKYMYMNAQPLHSTFDLDHGTDYHTGITTGKPGTTKEGISRENLFYRLPADIADHFDTKDIEDFSRTLNELIESGNKEQLKKGIIDIYVALWTPLQTGFTKSQLENIMERLNRFDSEFIIPIEQIGETKDFLLNETKGPTDAFKDLALQMLTEMVGTIVEEYNKAQVAYAKNIRNEHEGHYLLKKDEQQNLTFKEYLVGENIPRPKLKFIITQTSTSGDTGPAAQDGILDKDFIACIVGYPRNDATVGQRGQIQERSRDNVRALPFSESFTDIQDTMKNSKPEDWDERIQKILEESLKDLVDKYGFEIEVDSGSFNSINPGRIDGQMVYHSESLIHAKAKGMLDQNGEIIEVIPSGNGGHVFGVLMARQMTGIQGPTIVTCNENDMFYKIVEEGRFQKPPKNSATPQPSVSMIIEYPNNMWRLFAYAFGSERANNIAETFMKGDEVVLNDDERDILKGKLNIQAVMVNGETELESINSIFTEYGRLVCPHTANAYAGLGIVKMNDGLVHARPEIKSLISETASPWKFLAAVAAGLENINAADNLAGNTQLHKKTREVFYKEYQELEKTPEGCQQLIEKIKAAHEREGYVFDESMIPENLRKIYSEGFEEPEAKSADTFHEDSIAFVREYASEFARQVEGLLEAA